MQTNLYLEELEEHIKKNLIDQVKISSISELKNFPYNDMGDIKNAYSKNHITLTSPYNFEILELYGTRTEVRIHRFLLILPFIVIPGNIAIALFTKSWILLLGCLTGWLGYSSSSPFFKPRNFFGLTTALTAIVFMFFRWEVALIIGSYSIALFLTMGTRLQYQRVLIRRALSSEILFLGLFLEGNLWIRENRTMKTITPNY